HARELDQDAVAGRLDDAALVLGDLWVDQFAAMGSKPRESAGFVLAHHAAVAGDIGGENGRKPALDPLSAQDVLLGPTPAQSAPSPVALQRPIGCDCRATESNSCDYRSE